MVPFKLTTLEAVEAMVDKSQPLHLDFETAGFYGTICLAQFYQAHWPEVLIVQRPDPFGILSIVSSTKFVAFNVHYEITTLQQQLTYKKAIGNNYECLLLMSRLAFPQLTDFAFDDVCSHVLGFNPYQNINKSALQKSDWSAKVLTAEQLQYAATDVYYMPQVYEAAKSAQLSTSYSLDMLTLKYCLEMQWNGMPTDRKRLVAKMKANDIKLAEIGLPINPQSYKQVREYLGSALSDDITLARMEALGNDKAKVVRIAKKTMKQNSFIAKFLREPDNVIYGKFKPLARSGRLTSDDQNLQQLPRALKDCFGVEEDGDTVVLFADYAQLELRTICAITNCHKMAQLFRAGVDLHTYTAEFLFGTTTDEAEAKRRRQIAKGFNFLALYGGGILMLIDVILKQMGILLTEQEASAIRNKWRKLWAELYAWQRYGIDCYTKGILGSTPMGRKYKANLMTDQLNIENQGAGAEVSKLALHYLHKNYLSKYPAEWKVKVRNFIHDSYILTCINDETVYKTVAQDLAHCMQEAWFEVSKLFRIKDLPMPVEVGVGFNWGDIENDKIANLYDYTLEGSALYGT